MDKVFVQSPLAEALRVLTDAEPPEYVRGIRRDSDLSEEQMLELHDWCAMYAKPSWSTGIGTIEAAEHLVQEAIDNGNIFDPRSCEVCEHYCSATMSFRFRANYGKCRRTGENQSDSDSCEAFELAERWTDS